MPNIYDPVPTVGLRSLTAAQRLTLVCALLTAVLAALVACASCASVASGLVPPVLLAPAAAAFAALARAHVRALLRLVSLERDSACWLYRREVWQGKAR